MDPVHRPLHRLLPVRLRRLDEDHADPRRPRVCSARLHRRSTSATSSAARRSSSDAAADKLPEGTPFAKQLGDFYATCMDEAKLEDGAARAAQALAPVDGVKHLEAVATELARLHTRGVHALFGFGSLQDFKDATQVIGGLDQGGLGLPDRDYYLKDDAKTKEMREQLPRARRRRCSRSPGSPRPRRGSGAR